MHQYCKLDFKKLIHVSKFAADSIVCMFGMLSLCLYRVMSIFLMPGSREANIFRPPICMLEEFYFPLFTFIYLQLQHNLKINHFIDRNLAGVVSSTER